MKKREIGENYFKQGYNCSQSVVLAFIDEIGLDKEQALKIASSFGGGIGRQREVCGAVSGMMICLGALKGYSSPDNHTEKAEYYALIQNLCNKFKEINGSIVCRELLGLTTKSSDPTPEQRTDAYYKKRPCASLVGDAIEILEKYLKTNK